MPESAPLAAPISRVASDVTPSGEAMDVPRRAIVDGGRPPATAAPRTRVPRLAVTAGEPAGIGPELVAKLATRAFGAELVAIGDRAVLREAAARAGVALELVDFDHAAEPRAHRPGRIACVDVPVAAPVTPGRVDARNARHVLAMLAAAADGCVDGRYDGIVTAPVHKGVVNDGGVEFTGHTEFFAERAGREVVMLLAAPGLRVALATTHLPIARVPSALTRVRLTRDLAILLDQLAARFGLARPRIAVLGLNPHAGEGGYLGREEIDTIAPVCEALRRDGHDVVGPLSADTAFVPALRQRFDAYFAMYHDQGLPVLKALCFGDSVNVTLGLPYVRTSVDHGVALDLAGGNAADASSLVAATTLAIELAARGTALRAAAAADPTA